jgi:hypothetical protein
MFISSTGITTTANDTTAKWNALGPGYSFYGIAIQLNNQPSTWGFLINYSSRSDVFQLWNVQSSGGLYYRSGNASGWGTNWKKLIDTDGGTFTGNLMVESNGGGDTYIRVKNSNGTISLTSHSSRGIYDNTNSKWVLQASTGSADWTFHGTANYSKYFGYTNITNAVDLDQNLNRYTTPGCYVCTSSAAAANMVNCPVDIAFTMMVLPNAGCTQILIAYGQYSNKMYIRNYYNGNWYGWSLYSTNQGVSGTS